MDNPLYEALGFKPGDVADIEGLEAEIRVAVDRAVEKTKELAAEGQAVTPYTIALGFAVHLSPFNPVELITMYLMLGELFYRLACPRQEMPPI